MVFNEGETQSVFDHIGGGKEWSLDGIQNRFFIHIYQDFIRRADNNSSYYDLVIDYLKKSKSEYAVYMYPNAAACFGSRGPPGSCRPCPPSPDRPPRRPGGI